MISNQKIDPALLETVSGGAQEGINPFPGPDGDVAAWKKFGLDKKKPQRPQR